MKRVWKPIDVGGLRLYRVKRYLRWKPDDSHRTEKYEVFASSPKSAAGIIQKIFAESDKESSYYDCVSYVGQALNVLMPESWWQDGVPCVHDIENSATGGVTCTGEGYNDTAE